nr:putative B3 domain-containing protein Os04g0347400 [Setaria viridis]
MNQFCDVQQGTPKSKKYMSSTDAQKRVQGSMTYLNKARTKGAFEIGPPAWIKEINTSIIENQQLNLSLPFCEAIGLQQHCTITLKTSTRSTKSWKVCLNPYQHCCKLVGGLKRFFLENGIKLGHVCTMQIIEITLWNVIIDRREAGTR